MVTKKQVPDYDGVAYERYRPSYPKEMAEKLFSVTGYDPSQSILEIGCGTGKGTEVLLDQGAKVHAVEPNTSMGEIAAKKFSGRSFTWEPSTFEEYEGQDESFSVIYSAHAFHWVDQDIVFNKAHQLLRPGGALAICRNNRKHDDEFSKREHKIYVDLKGADPHGFWNENYYQALSECVGDFIKRGDGLFHRPQVYEFDHTITYSAQEYIGLQNTYWDDSQGGKDWQEILTRMEGIIQSMGGKIAYPYTTVLYLLFRR